MENIALFGTSADPPTIGHQTILCWLVSHYDRVVAWASDNPFKQQQTPLSHRTAMFRLAIANCNFTRHNISLHPELSDRHTLVTVNKARKKWGTEIELTLVIGSDILQQINSWYCIDKLLQEVKVLVVPRVGYRIHQSDLTELKRVGGNIAIAPFNVPKVSSSSFRQQKDKELITPAVHEYIIQHNLYELDTNPHESKPV